MRTMESIVADLRVQREQYEAQPGMRVHVQELDQEIIAHETLARLREERAVAEQAGLAGRVCDLDQQIGEWRSRVSVDVETPVPDEPSDGQAPAAGERGTAATGKSRVRR